ncbi:hypothetical protein Thiowin_00653 [Thiorhodovibrio winogradskyi]|uniref:DNA 3'-5' helicase II n=1 Tax=Thiorhodovibrio winogradskyi TaxID=77007 RepID=A0ABZ0S676_9GAMM|nr:ATP-binding domain-containing protein [Thiorhodovibrio winogradskyi]
MEVAVDSQDHIKAIAEEVLKQFEKTASVARAKLNEPLGLTPAALAGINTLTSGATLGHLQRIDGENRSSYSILAQEPAIARVVAEDESGQRHTYYFCRADQGMVDIGVISYRAPIGRLAALPIGEEFRLPNGRELYVLERSQLRPTATAGNWDSQNTVFEAERIGPVTIESLQALLTELAGEDVSADLLERLLAEEALKANVVEGVRRTVITKMGLRDQPVLDQYQDEIFRLSLANRLMILGPPGTGKTTTLIRRLGQKLDTTFLDEDERQLVEQLSAAGGVAHADSWLMFTPTELLKQYLKEAFAREGVAASDQRIRTWDNFRRELARQTFGVLRTGAGGGIFVLKEDLESLGPQALQQPIPWYQDFDAWQRGAYLQELRDASAALAASTSADAVALGERLSKPLKTAGAETLATTFSALAAEVPRVQTLVAGLKKDTDEKIRRTLTLQVNRKKDFLDELAKFIDTLQETLAADADDPDDPDAEDEDDDTGPQTGRHAAVRAYERALRAQARSAAARRKLNKASRNARIIHWIGDRTLSDADRETVGASLLIQSSVRRFVNPAKRYIDGIPKRYRAFRRLRQSEERWYAKARFEARDIHPLELDLILLALLRSGGELLDRAGIQRNIEDPVWSSLKPFLDLRRHQVLVDEATDFSPLQLACMGGLGHPTLRSFFACGDFNQRLTTWGTRSIDDLKWVFPDVEVKEVTVSYRQSRQLNELARAMIQVTGGSEQLATLPEHVDSEGVAPALLEAATGASTIAWLAGRIREIEQFVRRLPSIAIFVNTEAEVAAVAAALDAALAEDNIQVVACHEGQTVGQESNIRVFDVRHIKGLEFEAVFFIGIDRLADLHPDLFDKYLYVGTTRAATYLGVTCDGLLPPAIEELRPRFGRDWRTLGTIA